MTEDALNLIKKQLEEVNENSFNVPQQKYQGKKDSSIQKKSLEIKEEPKSAVSEIKMGEKKQEQEKKETPKVSEKKNNIKIKKEDIKTKKSKNNTKRKKTNKKVFKKKSKMPTKKKTNKKTKKVVKKPKRAKPKKGIRKFIILFVALIGIAFIIFLVFLLVGDKESPEKDEVIATVNGENIYLSEIEHRYELYQGLYSIEELLDQSIMEIVLLQEAERQGYSVTEREFEDMMEELFIAAGATREDLNKELMEVGITYEEYKESSMKSIIIRKLLEDVVEDVKVTEEEILDYYDMIKDDLPEEYEFEELKELINQSLMMDKRDALFEEYVDNLIEKADILIMHDSEIIGGSEEDVARKIELAECLSQNNIVLYSTTTCPACITQKNAFGQEAVNSLNIVECNLDEGRQECIDYGIEATPTWIVNGIKYVGVLSLEGLAELSGCDY